MTRATGLAASAVSGYECSSTRHHSQPVTWDAARERAHAAAAPLPPVLLPLAQAAGTVLAAALVAAGDLPPVDRSAMDGYAVRGPGPWTVLGAVGPGARPPAGLRECEAWAVVTGSALPAGTDAVLPDEDAVRTGDRLTGAVAPGRHVRRAGEECTAHEELVSASTLVRAPLLGLAAALGEDALRVHPQPRVAVLVTGDELVASGRPGPGRVRDAIGPMLPGLVAQAGGRADAAVRVPDERAALVGALGDTDADLLLVSGSSAAGPADHLHAALAALGAELLVDGVACRPGHPQSLARLRDGRLVVGLPGNPLAALAAFLTLAGPVLAGLRGAALPALVAAPVPGGLARHPTSTRLVPVQVRPGGVETVGHGGAAMLRGAAVADALAVVDPGPAAAIAVRMLPLDPGARPWAG